ncbi:hypothetical protein LSAT2_031956, partial [Lamellibrachia satsuma]
LQKVLDLIRNGWPDRKEKVPYEATPYFDVRDTLSHEEHAQLLRRAVSIQQIQVVYLNPKMMRHATTSRWPDMMATPQWN